MIKISLKLALVSSFVCLSLSTWAQESCAPSVEHQQKPWTQLEPPSCVGSHLKQRMLTHKRLLVDHLDGNPQSSISFYQILQISKYEFYEYTLQEFSELQNPLCKSEIYKFYSQLDAYLDTQSGDPNLPPTWEKTPSVKEAKLIETLSSPNKKQIWF